MTQKNNMPYINKYSIEYHLDHVNLNSESVPHTNMGCREQGFNISNQ